MWLILNFKIILGTHIIVPIFLMCFIDFMKWNMFAVFQISPTDGPPKGGTEVTIEGFNFGIKSDVTVTVAGVQCENVTFVGRRYVKHHAEISLIYKVHIFDIQVNMLFCSEELW